MIALLWFKRTILTALDVFGSTSSTEIAGLLMWAILGMIASVLVMVPGDQTAGGLAATYNWIIGR